MPTKGPHDKCAHVRFNLSSECKRAGCTPAGLSQGCRMQALTASLSNGAQPNPCSKGATSHQCAQ
eukprot:15482338-Alexandrium_andersonii.AAC.1